MKAPTECMNLIDVRAAIDELDHRIITLLGTRAEYVAAASQFKTSEAGVVAVDRRTTMLIQRRMWAEQAGLDPDMIEQVFRQLVDYFTRRELQHWQQQQ